MKKINNSASWNGISKSYQQRYKIKTTKYYWGPLCSSSLDSLLGEVRGKKVLEIGSGAGQNSIYLTKLGAKATAFDFSKEQILHGLNLAKNEGVDVKYICGNFEKLSEYSLENDYDLIISSFAFQYCQTIQTLNKLMRSIYSLLKTGGSLIFSVDHPVRDHGYWDNNDQFILNSYFDRDTKVWAYSFPEDNISEDMIGSFKTVSDYVNAVVESGLRLEKIVEPEPIENEAENNFGSKSRYIKNPEKNPFSYDHLRRVPGTLVIKATKI